MLRWDGPVFEGKPWMTFYVTDVIVSPQHDVNNTGPNILPDVDFSRTFGAEYWQRIRSGLSTLPTRMPP